jgi:DNA-directed RNA polymerase subunit RPC12/RpoP
MPAKASCQYCGSIAMVPFPCCGSLCMACGKLNEESEDSNKPAIKPGGDECC